MKFEPIMIIGLLLFISFLVILLLNIKLKNKVLNTLFFLFSSLFLILIIIIDNSFVYTFLKSIITYLWYPDYLLFSSTVILSILVFIYTYFQKKIINLKKIFNYTLFCIEFLCYFLFQTMDIDVKLYSSLYQIKSLSIMRIGTITFYLWIIINIILKIKERRELHEK